MTSWKRQTEPGDSGGPGGAGGYNFQYEIATLLTTYMLGQSSPDALGLATSSIITKLHFEPDSDVDDLVVITSDDRRVFVQSKRTCNLSRLPTSPLGKTARQFVRQFFAPASSPGGSSERPFDPDQDLLVLAVGPSAPNTVRERLRSGLQRLRRSQGGQALPPLTTDALSRFRTHLREATREVLERDLTDGEERRLLGSCIVWSLPSIPAEASKGELSRSVLAKPEDASNAWDVIFREVAEGCANRWVSSSSSLRQLLRDQRGFELQDAPIYRQDLGRIRDHTQRVTGRLQDLGRISLDSHVLRVERPIAEQISATIEAGQSLLLVGDPGDGKSGVLHQLVTSLRLATDRLVLVVEAEPGSSGSLTELLQLLDHPLEDVLAAAGGSGPPVLVVDALDACRDQTSQREWIQKLGDLARSRASPVIAASVRTFHLRYSPELQQHFRGVPPTPASLPDLRGVCHVHVSGFDEHELQALSSQWEPLKDLLDRVGSPEFLRSPFHLRLACELLSEGVSLSSLASLETPLELLDRYWEYRVRGLDDGRQTGGFSGTTERLDVLKDICTEIVRSRRFRVPIAGIASSRKAFGELLHSRVLIEDSTQVAFSHHALTDYALERLLLESLQDLEQTLQGPGDLALFLTPSLRLRLHRLWKEDPTQRSPFWECFARLLAGRQALASLEVFFAASGVEWVEAPADVAVVLSVLQSQGEETTTRGLGRLLTALRALQDQSRHLLGMPPNPWITLLDQLVASGESHYAEGIRLLELLVRNLQQDTPGETSIPPTDSEAISLVESACSLLDTLEGLRTRTPGAPYFWVPLRVLMKLCSSCPHLAVSRLQRCLSPEVFLNDSRRYLQPLVLEISSLMESQLELAAAIYEATFSHREDSDSPVLLGGQVLALISHRRQEHEGLQYHLQSVFPELIQASLPVALRTLCRIFNASISEHTKPPAVEFTFRGETIALRRDESSLWPELESLPGDLRQMSDALFGELDAMLEDQLESGALEKFLDVFARAARSPFLWQQLLRLGSRHPERLGIHLSEPLSQSDFLLGSVLSYWTREWLQACFSSLDSNTKTAIETAILELHRRPSRQELQGTEHFAKLAGSYLARIPEGEIRTPATKQLRTSLLEQGLADSHVPPFTVSTSTEEYTVGDWLQGGGVDPSTPEHSAVLEATRNLEQEIVTSKELESDGRSDTEAAAHLIEAAETLSRVLEASSSLIDSAVEEHAHGVLLRGWTRTLQVSGRNLPTSRFEAIESALVRGSEHPAPSYGPEREAEFEQQCGWSSSPRVEATAGLTFLGKLRPSSPEGLNAIRRLASDPAPEIRFHIARSLSYLSAPDRSEFEAIALERADLETNPSVLSPLFGHSLSGFLRPRWDEFFDRLDATLSRLGEWDGKDRFGMTIAQIARDLFLYRAEPSAARFVQRLLSRFDSDPESVVQLLNFRRDLLVSNEDVSEGRMASDLRSTAFSLLVRVAEIGIPRLEDLLQQRQPTPTTSEEAKGLDEEIRRFMKVLGAITNELYFGSEAHLFRGGRQKEEGQLDAETRGRFWTECQPLLDVLRVPPGFGSSLHDVVRFLASFIDHDPEGVLQRLLQFLSSDSGRLYVGDSLGGNLVVEICQHYLIHHPGVVTDATSNSSLLALVDLLVESSWPAGLSLATRLHEVWR